MLVSDLLYAAFRAAGIVTGAGRGLSLDDQTEGLNALNDLIDEWSAERRFGYATPFEILNLIPNQQVYMIGPTAGGYPGGLGWGLSRPVRIESAAVILTDGTPAVDTPVNIRDADWWAGVRSKSITSTIPTDAVYFPEIPNGQLWLWPIPTEAYELRIELWAQLGSFLNVTQSLSPIPPAYTNALKFTLAENLALAYGKPPNPALAQKAARARVAVQSNNLKSPRVRATDPGTSGSGGSLRSGFNWMRGF